MPIELLHLQLIVQYKVRYRNQVLEVYAACLN